MDFFRDQPGQRHAAHARQRNGRHEAGDRFGSILGPEPMCQVHDHRREETALEEAEQEAQEIKLVLGRIVQSVNAPGNARDDFQIALTAEENRYPTKDRAKRLVDAVNHAAVLRHVRHPAEHLVGERCADGALQRRADPPQDQDAHENPARSATHNPDGAWDFQDPVTQEKDGCTKAGNRRIKAQAALVQGLAHGLFGHGHIDPIKVG